jgi:hypothetical protein
MSHLKSFSSFTVYLEKLNAFKSLLQKYRIGEPGKLDQKARVAASARMVGLQVKE